MSISGSISTSTTNGKSTNSTRNKCITAGIRSGSIRVDMSHGIVDICGIGHDISIIVLLVNRQMHNQHLSLKEQPGTSGSLVILVTPTRLRLIGRPYPTR